MANIKKIRNKDESLSYQIKVFKGKNAAGKQLKPYFMTWKAPLTMKEKVADKEAERQAHLFEEKCKQGTVADNRQTFEVYANYVIDLKRRTGLKDSTYNIYKGMLVRINAGIGHLKIKDIQPGHINEFYKQLSQKGVRIEHTKAICKADIKDLLKKEGLTQEQFVDQAGICLKTLHSAIKGNSIKIESAEKIADTFHLPINKMFKIMGGSQQPLSNKTILEYHRLISTILNQAEKELLVNFNAARKATPPKAKKPKVNFLEIEAIQKILEYLPQEPLKWQAFIYLLIFTGCRRGEIAGLKWDCIDFDKATINVKNNLLYTPERGIYLDTPKTETSERIITFDRSIIPVLQEYKKEQTADILKSGNKWNRTDFVFCQENGEPIFPSSVNLYLNRFTEKYDLPHINPHAFRHSMVSMLFRKGLDPITISKRLGHSKVSTTTDIYAHVMANADQTAADAIGDILLDDSGTTGRK
jgi:integrase